MGKSYQEVLQWASSFLEERGEDPYSILYVFLARKSWTKTDWLIQMHQMITEEEEQQIKLDLQALVDHYPPQYLIGYCEFYGENYKVNGATLIPRPETEGLVNLCLLENSTQHLSVVDIGTGSGVIAISLKKNRPLWTVEAVDISNEALQVAKYNAASLKTNVQFHLGDGLQPVIEHQKKVDIIISNPPYISEQEWSLMDESVRIFEPKQALFAEQEGLAIYQKLAHEAPQVLKDSGKIYLEIGFRQGQQVKEIMCAAFPNKRVHVLKDMSGNDRFVIVS